MAGSFNHGSLGAALPIALGAAAVDPTRQVWAFCGDGGFGMSMNDFVERRPLRLAGQGAGLQQLGTRAS